MAQALLGWATASVCSAARPVLHFCCEEGDGAAAPGLELFDVVWRQSMVCLGQKQMEKALQLFRVIQRERFMPDFSTYSAVASGCELSYCGGMLTARRADPSEHAPASVDAA